MPSIPFAGVQTIAATNTAQPVFGTTTTAAANPTYDQFAGNVNGANQSTTTLAVVSTNGFNPGQYVLVGASYQLGSANPNYGMVKTIISSTSMTVQGLTQSVASGSYVLLMESAESITVKSLGAASMYIGTSQLMTPTNQYVIDVIAPGQSFHAETTDRGHAYNTSQYWIVGTLSDSFIPSFSQG